MENNSSGFSLIEVIIVLAIVAVLATLALPGFDRLAQPSHRQLMQAELLLIAQQLEQTYSQNQRYQSIELEPFPADTPRYALSLQIANDGQSFTLRADPLDQPLDDGYLTLDSSGNKMRYPSEDGGHVPW